MPSLQVPRQLLGSYIWRLNTYPGTWKPGRVSKVQCYLRLGISITVQLHAVQGPQSLLRLAKIMGARQAHRPTTGLAGIIDWRRQNRFLMRLTAASRFEPTPTARRRTRTTRSLSTAFAWSIRLLSCCCRLHPHLPSFFLPATVCSSSRIWAHFEEPLWRWKET